MVACGTDEDRDDTYDATVPVDEIEVDDTAAIERARHDSSWRPHADRDRRMRDAARRGMHPPARRTGADAPDTTDQAMPAAATDSIGEASPAGLATPADPPADDRRRPSVLRVQVLLDRARFSPGVVDGSWGKNTEKAVYWFQHREGLETTGLIDDATYRRLEEHGGDEAAIARYRIRRRDLEGPFAPDPPEIYAKAEQRCLCYTSPVERLSERFHTTPEFLRRLNRELRLETLEEDDWILVPNVRADPDRWSPAAHVLVSTDGFYTHALDEDGEILYHFPSTLGSPYSPSPTGGYSITAIVPWPRFHFTPALFKDVPDDRPDALLPPGPNSPIGTVWMQLSEPFYGIHGTADPETIGYVTSHGCVRLTNWDARILARMVRRGTPVEFR